MAAGVGVGGGETGTVEGRVRVRTVKGKGTKRRRGTVAPSLREERRLLRSGHTLLAAMDEVGRGALAGPVTVGVVVVDVTTRSAPSGVRDSKLLTPAARTALVPKLRRWAPAHAVGHAEPHEIDTVGIIAALRLAGWRALAQLAVRPDCVLLDGNHDWLTHKPPKDAVDPDAPTLFDLPARPEPPAVPSTVVTRIKADMRCAAVAAASVLAKVERDSIMVARAAEHPAYGWELNKGYAAPDHVRALRAHGASLQHRTSWSLPGIGGLADLAAGGGEELPLGLGSADDDDLDLGGELDDVEAGLDEDVDEDLDDEDLDEDLDDELDGELDGELDELDDVPG
jgi:ribonuclease HII